jgi:diguanylate cyclase (GGDEF)-like protein
LDHSVSRRADRPANRRPRESIAALRSEIGHYATVLGKIGQGVCYFSGDQRLILSNGRYAEMYGLSPQDIVPGLALGEIAERRFAVGACPKVTYDEYIDWCDKVNHGTEHRIWSTELQDGRTIRIYHQPMSDGGWVATHEDVTEHTRTAGQLLQTRASLVEAHVEQARSQAKIAHQARYDVLTDLPNRIAFAERLKSAIEQATAEGGNFALLRVDLDYFKNVNEFFGHAMGDGLLRELGERFQAAADGAFAARGDGDEFFLLSLEGEQPLSAASLADRLQAAVADELEIDGQRMRIGLSIGIAVYPADGIDEITLLGNADAALLRAKSEGRGSFRFFDNDMDKRQRERLAVQHELSSVLQDGELVLHYQPLSKIGGEAFGFEALVRWQHPKRGLLLPNEFIPLAEESGFISDIGAWVLREACREAASWKRPLQIAVNVSPLQFGYPDLTELVHSVLLETGLAPGRLELEITEGVLSSDPARVLSVLRRLKSLGVKIAMDDFGTGYSSLSSLQSFPFDKIKIDREFISNLGRNEQSSAIVRAVIGLGRNLNMPVIAEGVETEDQRAILMREGCQEIQGYLFGRPLAISRYSDLTGSTVDAGPTPRAAILACA